MEAIQEFGIHIEQVEIYSLEQGNVDIEMTIPYCQGHGECEKLNCTDAFRYIRGNNCC